MTQKQTATKKVLELIGDSLKKGKNYSLEKEQLKELFDDFGDEILDPMKSKHGEKYIQKLSKEHENLEAFRDYIINRFVSLVAQKSFNEYGMFEEPEGIELFLTLIKTDETDKKTAQEELKELYDLDTFREIVSDGCDSGIAHFHVFYKETVEFFDKHEKEITEYLKNKLGKEKFVELSKKNDGNPKLYKNDCSWKYIELIASEIVEEYDSSEED